MSPAASVRGVSLGLSGNWRSSHSGGSRGKVTHHSVHLGRGHLDGPYPYVWLDFPVNALRGGGDVNADGQREILGMDVGSSEEGAGQQIHGSLTARDASGPGWSW